MQLHQIHTCQAVGSLGSGVSWLWREPAALNSRLPGLLRALAQGAPGAVPADLSSLPLWA